MLDARTTSLECFCKVLKLFTFFVNLFFYFQISIFQIFDTFQTGDCFSMACARGMDNSGKKLKLQCLMGLNSRSSLAAKELDDFEWFPHWYRTLIFFAAKNFHTPHISEIASKNRYLKVEKKVDEKSEEFQNFAKTL